MQVISPQQNRRKENKMNKMHKLVLGLAAAGVLLVSHAGNAEARRLGQSFEVVPATETISAGGTITADACGGLKRVTCSGDVTTSTTNTFTAPSESNKGCRMTVTNVGSGTLYLDGNALFPLTQGFASMALAPGGSIEVWSDGSFWRKANWSEF
jgi:hypothetical protein